MTLAHADPARNTRSVVARLLDPNSRAGALGLWGPVVAYCAGIFYLSSLSMPPAPLDVFPDKLGHIILYGGLGFLVARYLRIGHGLGGLAIGALAAIFCLVYGATDEFHQYFVEGRNAEIGDVVADFFGGILGGSAYDLFRRNRLQTNTRPCDPAGGP
jgi:VanZ family protein